MRSPLSTALYAAIVVIGGLPADAGTLIAHSATVNQPAFGNTGNLTLEVVDFDPSLGTLTGAMLMLAAFTGPQFEVINLGDVAGTGVTSTMVSWAGPRRC